MNIEKNRVVAIDYTLTDNEGVVIDTSAGRAPLKYLHGTGALIPGLEKELEGKITGDKLDVSIPPEEGYGVRNEQLLQVVPKKHFGDTPDIQPGMQFQANSPQGPILVTIMEVNDDTVVVDGNHPLAGVVLNFKVEIKAVRAASAEEIEQSQVSEEGGSTN
ncbi:MAG: peptidylprolyl isomerase [Bacteroidota bacterium]